MPNAIHFKRNELPFIPCKAPGGETTIARVINGKISRHMGGGLEIAENIKVHWTTLYDEILFIHEGSMIIRTDQGEMECHVGDIVWLPEGCTLDYDITGRRCAYFYALYPFDWAKRNGMEEP
jgi:ethanolamine utilization protein EutQ (cupin superfamily)